MKIMNYTESGPLVKEILDNHPAPGWVLAYLGTFLTFVIIMTMICHKYCPLCTAGCAISCENANRGCAMFCGLFHGFIRTSTQSCVLCGEYYKTCVDTTYECATYTPAATRSVPKPERVNMRQLPVVKY